ncbi:MAG: sugar kinase [Firmicutes bacterium]|nr:sugar kinase [Bacillota bacterium]
MPRFVTLGETLIRLSVPSGYSLEAPPYLNIQAAGAESNVAIGLARFGHSASYLSVLPDNDLGRFIAGELRRQGVDLDGLAFVPGGRAGLYFLELGVAPRVGKVIYDRAGSAFANADPETLKWSVMDGATLLHLTGITLAVNASVALRGLDEARRRGLKVSFDLNYRHKLWSPERARDALAAVLGRVDVLITTLEDAQAVLNVEGTAEQVAHALFETYAPEVAVVTNGAQGASASGKEGAFSVAGYELHVLDRIGAGDAFVAGFLSGWLSKGSSYGLQLGLAMAALKHTYYGDVAWVNRETVQALIDRRHSGWR